nr:hypothetical protein [Allomuricauda sp.]
MKNLWPKKFGENHITTPKELLTTQANYLTESTSGKLQGVIRTSSISPDQIFHSLADDFGENCFSHSFTVNAPRLDYKFSILRLVHPVLKIYPFKVVSSLSGKVYDGENNEQLEAILSSIFSEKEVIDALDSLASQSTESNVP